MINKENIDPNALTYYRMLKDAGFCAYFVGGSVRDLLLDKVPKDFDIATNATPQQIKRVIPYGRIIGRRFRHVMLERDGGRYEIVTFRGPIAKQEEAESTDESEASIEDAEDGAEESAAPRKNFPDLNQFGTAEQDAIRRDFTINALFYDPDVDELVDYVHGKPDIDNRLLRTIGNPMERMEEDPIRILRAMRHKSKLALQYDQGLEEAMREKASFLAETSKDRIREEFLKVSNDRSLVSFLREAKSLGILFHFAPWFQEITEEEWNSAEKAWEEFSKSPLAEKQGADLGVSLMMSPLVRPLVLDPYKASLDPETKNYLPDMKYFLGCEPLRNYFLRNLRISRLQTDHVIRALFYWSRMTGLWLENGPPRKIIGKLHHHPPAVLAAKMAVMSLIANGGTAAPEWMQELAEYDQRKRTRGQERNERGDSQDPEAGDEAEGDQRPQRRERHSRQERSPERHSRGEGDQQEESSADGGREHPRREREREHAPPPKALPPPEKPLVWNGPLHAPVLRPIFNEEPAQRWARKNQGVNAYRPSGIPNQPTDLTALKLNIVSNYKPEITTTADSGESERPQREHSSRERGERNDRSRRGGRGRRDRGDSRPERGPQQPRHAGPEASREEEAAVAAPEEEQMQVDAHEQYEEAESPGNAAPAAAETPRRLYPGEEELPVEYGDDDLDDNIGNRLDAPPTSGHVGVNGEGVLHGGRPQGAAGPRSTNDDQRRRGSRGGRGRRQQRGGRRFRGGQGGGGGGVSGGGGVNRTPV